MQAWDVAGAFLINRFSKVIVSASRRAGITPTRMLYDCRHASPLGIANPATTQTGVPGRAGLAWLPAAGLAGLRLAVRRVRLHPAAAGAVLAALLHLLAAPAVWRHVGLTALETGVGFLAATLLAIGIDDTIERRWGRKISARGIYRDPVRSSKGHFVKTSGLRWLSAQLLVHIPWAGRIMGLPFLTVLAPSKRFYDGKPRSAKTLLDWARQVALQIHRWLPGRRIVIVGDTAFAAIDFLGAVRNYVSVVT